MKKMSKKLQAALSLDDELYARYKAQEKRLFMLHERYIRNPRRIISVLGRDKSGTLYKMRIESVETTPDGTVVCVTL